MKDYKDSGRELKNDIDFGMEILTSGHWPTQDQSKLNLQIPSPMRALKENYFDKFYHVRYPNRQLVWLYNHGQVTATPHYLDKNYMFIVSPY